MFISIHINKTRGEINLPILQPNVYNDQYKIIERWILFAKISTKMFLEVDMKYYSISHAFFNSEVLLGLHFGSLYKAPIFCKYALRYSL